MTDRSTALLVVVALAIAGCGAGDTSGSEAAERAFVACAEDHGVAIEHVEITPGDVSVEVADDAPPAAVEQVESECEPRAMDVLREGGAVEEEPETPEVPAGVSDVDGYLAHLREDGFSGVVLAEAGGRTVASQASGEADHRTGAPHQLGTAFDIGSIAKTFTAAAVLRAVDAGDLALHDTLGERLDDVPTDKQDITVQMLLDFSSGLHPYHDRQGDFEPMTRDEARQHILAQELLFAPGTDTAYSNSSYSLAAMVLEEVTGRPFTELFDELVADAGLTDTGLYGSDTVRRLDAAIGRSEQTHRANDPTRWELTWALVGAGGVVSTATDVRDWWHQLQRPGLLSAASIDVLRGELFPEQEIDGIRARGLGGTNDFGFDALVAEVADADLLVVVLTNANPPERTIASETGFVLTQLALAERAGT